MLEGFVSHRQSQILSCCLQHADIAQLVDKEKQRFDTWPEKMAKLDDAARQAAETLAQLEREHQDQVGLPVISICCSCMIVPYGHCCVDFKVESLDPRRLLCAVQMALQSHQ